MSSAYGDNAVKRYTRAAAAVDKARAALFKAELPIRSKVEGIRSAAQTESYEADPVYCKARERYVAAVNQAEACWREATKVRPHA